MRLRRRRGSCWRCGRLGQVLIERDQARADRDGWRERCIRWRHHARLLEREVAELRSRLAHPARGDQAA